MGKSVLVGNIGGKMYYLHVFNLGDQDWNVTIQGKGDQGQCIHEIIYPSDVHTLPTHIQQSITLELLLCRSKLKTETVK